MNSINIFIKTVLFSLLITFTISSCNKEADIIGSDIQPPSEVLNLQFTDSVDIYAYSILEDTIVSSNVYQDVVGFLNDPVFGKFKSGFATQLHLPSRSVNFGENAVVDSVVLVVAYKGFYGDTNSAVNFKVYEIDEDLIKDSSYNQNYNLKYISKPLNEEPNLYQTSEINKIKITQQDTTFPAFRIKLSSSWAQKRIFSKSGSWELENNINFKIYFKGLYIVAEDAYKLGHLLYLGINQSAKSGVFIYYHNSTGVKEPFQLKVENECSRINLYNHFNHSTSNIEIINQVVNKDTLLGKEKLYLKPCGGYNVKICFPNIKNRFNRRRVVINKAELIISNLITNYNTMYPPAKLTLAKNTATIGSYQFLPDDALFNGDQYFGGSYDLNKHQYRFRITRYIQKLIDSNEEDNGITLFISSRSALGNRLLFGGYNPSQISKDKKLKLELSYTFLD